MAARATKFSNPCRVVGNMRAMLHGVVAFNQPVGWWDVGRVGNITSMFRGAVAFEQHNTAPWARDAAFR